MLVPVISGCLGNVGFGIIYSHISQKFSLLCQVPLTSQMKAFALSTVAQGIFTYHSSFQESRSFFIKRCLCTYLLISSSMYFFHREAIKANAMSTFVLGTAQLVIGKLTHLLQQPLPPHQLSEEEVIQQVLSWKTEEIDSKMQEGDFQVSDQVKNCNIDDLCGFKKEYLGVSRAQILDLLNTSSLSETTQKFFSDGLEASADEEWKLGFSPNHRVHLQLVKGYTYSLILSLNSWDADDEKKQSIAKRYYETCTDEDSCVFHKIGLLQQLTLEINKGKEGISPVEKAAIVLAQTIEACVTELVIKLCTEPNNDVANIQRETLFRVYKELKRQGQLASIPEIAQVGITDLERDASGGESQYFSERICKEAFENSMKNLNPVKVWIKGSGAPDFDQEIALFIDDQVDEDKSLSIKNFMAHVEGEEEKDPCIVAATSEQMRLVYFLKNNIISLSSV